MTPKLHLGDCLEVLRTLPDESVHAVVTDPPAGISFMGKAWDDDKGGRKQWVAWLESVMVECLRVLKPGGHAMVWALPRTSHWTGWAVEGAGFEVRDVITHHFGSGFPKSKSVAMSLDKLGGMGPRGKAFTVAGDVSHIQSMDGAAGEHGDHVGRSDDAKRWQGWGTALKPASEHWIIARKPFKGTVAGNVVEHGTGGVNVEACRVEGGARANIESHVTTDAELGFSGIGGSKADGTTTKGRHPPNLLLTHGADCQRAGTRTVATGTAVKHRSSGKNCHSDTKKPPAPDQTHGANGVEVVDRWECGPGCPVAEIDRQSGPGSSSYGVIRKAAKPTSNAFGAEQASVTEQGYIDTGGASRFFPTFEYEPPFAYIPKAPQREKNAGLDGFEDDRNKHPTPKSVALMSWLCKLVTPPGGTVLDPFMGSGTTGVACNAEGFEFIGIEMDPGYYQIARARIEHATSSRVDEVSGDAPARPQKTQTELF